MPDSLFPEYKICPDCGFTNDDIASYCWHCGALLVEVELDDEVDEEDFEEV